MRLKHLLLSLLIPCALFATPLQYDNCRIENISISFENLEGNTVAARNAALAKMQTRVGNRFSQDEFDNDLKTLAQEYDYVEPTLTQVGDLLNLDLKIWVKPKIRAITFCGNERFRSKRLLKKLEVEVGSLFEREEFQSGINKLRLFYIKKGYFEAHIRYELVTDEECGELEICVYIDEGRAGRIKKISICGVTHCEEEEIFDMMLTKRHIFLVSMITGAGCYHPEMIEHDRLTIINYMQNRGFADASCDICIDEDCASARIDVAITVDKGPLYTIGGLRIEGNTLFTKEDLYSNFATCIGAVYSPDAIRESARAIEDRYGVCGYIDASCGINLSLDPESPIYYASFDVEEGDQYSVGLVKVFGNRYTQPRVILHENLLCPGEVFNSRKLEGTQLRLLHTGFFSNVNVYAVSCYDESDYHTRDVYIEVEEADTGHLGLFFGFSSLDRLFGGAEVTERNFNIGGILSILQYGPASLRGGGEYFNVKVNLGDKNTTYLLQWSKPYFLDTPWIVGFDLEKSDNRAVSNAYEIKTWGGHVTATYIQNAFLKYAIHYRGQHTDNSVRNTGDPELEAQAGISGWVSGLGLSVLYNSTNNPRKPTSGFRSTLRAEIVGLGGNFDFMKFGYLNCFYYPLFSKGVFKFRLDAQFIKTYGTTTPKKLPLGERFYLGGETTVRGYRPFIIGSKFAANEPRGGVSSLLASEEFQYSLLPGIDGFIFIDSGFISLTEFTIGELSTSVGFGLRVDLIANMPFTVGLGYPVHFNEAETQRFFFSMGGNF